MNEKSTNRMETAAVYWEPKIKTFGFQEKTGLLLVQALFDMREQNDFLSFLHGLENEEIPFHLILIQPAAPPAIRFTLVLDRKWEKRICASGDPINRWKNTERFLIQSPVELISFFGPHFGERYGIADATFQLFAENGFSFLATGFSGSAVHLVLPEDGIRKIRPFLPETFEVPKCKSAGLNKPVGMT